MTDLQDTKRTLAALKTLTKQRRQLARTLMSDFDKRLGNASTQLTIPYQFGPQRFYVYSKLAAAEKELKELFGDDLVGRKLWCQLPYDLFLHREFPGIIAGFFDYRTRGKNAKLVLCFKSDEDAVKFKLCHPELWEGCVE